MRLFQYSTLSVSIALAVMAGGCGKRDVNADKLVKAEEIAEAKGSMSTALVTAKQEVQRQPQSGKARFDLGATLLAEGDPKAAAIELKQALELKHPDEVVLPMLADALVQSHQYAPLVDGYANTKLNDAAAQARLLASVAQAMAARGDVSAATKTINAALASDPKSVAAQLMKARLAGMRNESDAAIATLDDLLRQNPTADEAWVLKGELLQQRPNGIKPALEAYQQALTIRPTNTTALAATVAMFVAQGDLERARTSLAALKKAAPKGANTAYIEAHVAFASGDHAKAKEVFQTLLRVLPEDLNVLLSAGENELKLDSGLQAESLFAKAQALAPANPIARRLLARAQIKLGKAAHALVTLAPLVDTPDPGADVLFLAASAHLLNGEAKAADALFSRLAKLQPTDPQLRTAIAVASLGKQDDSAAFRQLQLISGEDRGTSADLALISAHQRKGQWDQALQAADVLARKQPNDPMVPHLRGQLMALKKDGAQARQSFEQALKINPTYFPSIAALAALDLQDNQAENARKRFVELIKAQPKNAQALLGLAEISTKQGAPRADVLRELNAAVKAAPADVGINLAVISHHLADGETDLALAAARTAVAAYPESFELLDMLARCQIRAKQTQQALTSYGKIASLNPKAPHAYLGMIDAHLANNDLDAAQRAVTKLLEMSPNLPAALGRAAMISIRKNQPAAGLAIARQLQAKPETAREGLLLEGQIEISRSNWDAAIAVLRKAVDQYDASNGALMLHTALTRTGKTAAAKTLTNSWLGKHPKDAGFLFYLGSYAEQLKDLPAAEQRYREVLAIDPNNILALNNLAMMLVQQKKSGAVPLAERAVAGAQDKANYLDTLAQAYASENDFGKAVDAQKRAVALAPQEHSWRLALARLQLKAGNKTAAKAELDKLAALGKSFAQQSEVSSLREGLSSLASGR